MKFERMAEIKFMYKKLLDDPDQVKERDLEIQQVKDEMEQLKQQRVAEAKDRTEEKKKKL